MKCIMRLDKSQVPAITKLTTPGSGIFQAHTAIMAGYKNFDVMCVGARGGRTGDVAKGTNNHRASGAGGGGGGMIRASGLLSILPGLVPYEVGEAPPAQATHTQMALDGTDGGKSKFNTWEAYGGNGSNSGEVDTNNNGSLNYLYPSFGGMGGGNSANLGVPGNGGRGKGSEAGWDTVIAATAGTYVAGVAPVVGGSCGGGGGRGQSRVSGDIISESSDGAAGANGNALYLASGATKVDDSGAPGGGANIKAITGSDEFYGGRQNEGGVVVIKLS